MMKNELKQNEVKKEMLEVMAALSPEDKLFCIRFFQAVLVSGKDPVESLEQIENDMNREHDPGMKDIAQAWKEDREKRNNK